MSVNQNTEVNTDVQEHFVMSQIFRKKKEQKSDEAKESDEEDDIDAWTYQPKRRTLEEIDGQQYVYGYMAKSLMKTKEWCGQYTYQIESSPDESATGKENYVEDLSRGGLVQPSEEWTNPPKLQLSETNRLTTLRKDRTEQPWSIRANQLSSIGALSNTSTVIVVQRRNAEWRYRLDVFTETRRIFFERQSFKFQHFYGVQF
ncbi:hypothetical protein quinque_002323 [Culex quinquefasciatus]